MDKNKITSVTQLKSILTHLLELIENTTKEETEEVEEVEEVESTNTESVNTSTSDSEEYHNTNTSDEHDTLHKQSVTLANNGSVIDYLISVVHREFTIAADYMYGDGIYSQEERITLSNAVGIMLDTFNAFIDENLPHLRQVSRLIKTNVEADVQTIDPNTVTFIAPVTIHKADSEKRLSYGVAYPAKPLGWHDSQNDYMTPEEITKAAHHYMINSRAYDMHHVKLDVTNDEAVVVESYIAPVDFTVNDHVITKGSWVVVTHYPDIQVWERVKKGEFAAYSISGVGKRAKLTI